MWMFSAYADDADPADGDAHAPWAGASAGVNDIRPYPPAVPPGRECGCHDGGRHGYAGANDAVPHAHADVSASLTQGAMCQFP